MAAAGQVREYFVDRPNGGFHLVKEQECDAILKAIKEAPDLMVRRRLDTQNSQKYVGSVPNILAIHWAKEWGVKLYSKEWTRLAHQRITKDPNWRLLRAGH